MRVVELSSRAGTLVLAAAFAAVPISPSWSQDEAGESEPDDRAELRLEAAPALQELPAPPPPSDVFRVGGSDYEIGRQDLLEIRVFDLEELETTVRVSDDGSISLPLLGRMQVAGLTKTELEGLIARLLEERFVRDPQVTVFVKEYESKKVAVSGAVKRPGTYEMLGRKTLLEMISMAGGLDQDFGREIIVFREQRDGSTIRIPIDLEGLVYEADPALNLELMPSDIVYIPVIEKIRVFVGGAVKSPNMYEIPRNEPVTC